MNWGAKLQIIMHYTLLIMNYFVFLQTKYEKSAYGKTGESKFWK